MNPNPNAPVQQPNWFSRNWKWLVPVGCLVPLTCCGVFSIGTYLGVSKIIQSSGAYVGALAEVNANPEVQATIGTPVVPGMGMQGSVKEEGQGGSADFTVPIEGNKGKGELHVVAKRSNGQWNYTTIEVTAGGKTIDVLKSAQPEDQPDVPPEDDQEPQDPEPDGD
jgi:hypothetical protein